MVGAAVEVLFVVTVSMDSFFLSIVVDVIVLLVVVVSISSLALLVADVVDVVLSDVSTTSVTTEFPFGVPSPSPSSLRVPRQLGVLLVVVGIVAIGIQAHSVTVSVSS